MKIKISCLDVYDPAVRGLFDSVAPENFQLAMADSHETDEQMKLAENADFIITGGSPVPEQMLRSMKKIKLTNRPDTTTDQLLISESPATSNW